eukprot:5487057-Pleurochrysis_carterae.AAC.1
MEEQMLSAPPNWPFNPVVHIGSFMNFCCKVLFMLNRGEDVNLWDMLYQRVLSTNPDAFHPQIPP